MKIKPTPIQKKYLKAMGVRRLWMNVDKATVQAEIFHATQQHPEENFDEQVARAIARVAHRKYGSKSELRWLVPIIAILVMLAVSTSLGHCQVAAVQIQNSDGSALKSWFAGIAKLKCGAGITCSSASGVVTFGSSASAPDWSAILNKPTNFQADWVSTIINKPTIPAAQVQTDWNAGAGMGVLLNKPSLATVATSGSYADLSNKPSIPAAQVQTDWSAVSGMGQLLNKPTLGTIASHATTEFAASNAATTVNGTSCVLGSSCTPTGHGLDAAYVDWNSGSGGNSILNKPTLAGAGACTNGVTVAINGGSAPTCTTADTTITHALFATAGTPAFRTIAATDLPVALANQTSINGVSVTSGKTFMYIDTSVQASQMPALTGDATTSSGAVATTVAKIQSSSMTVVTALGTTGTVSMDFSLGHVFTLTPTAAITLNATNCATGRWATIIVLSSGASSFTTTPTTNFKGTALATGTTTGKTFGWSFVCNGTTAVQMGSATAAM